MPREPFVQNESGQPDRENNTEFIHRGDAGGFAELERAEIANPRQAGREAGQNEEEPVAAIEQL